MEWHMSVSVREVFKRHCGPGAMFVYSEMQNRGEHNTVAIQFDIVPEGRRFALDGVIHEPCGDGEVKAAVLKIADIARNVRQHISAEG
jgi:hypothetical protein